jgi:hypothetical protein
MASESIPQVRGPSVTPSGQQPGFQNVDYNPEAFGAGIGRALLQTSATFQDAAKTEAVLSDQKRANDVLTDVNAAKDELRPWLFDPKDGAFAKKGGAAQGLGGQADVVLTDIRDRYLKKITDPKSKAAFEKLWGAESESTKDKIANHELDQLGQYKADTNKGVILGSMQDAYNYYNDPKAIDKAISDTRKAIHVNSAGLPPELLASAEKDAVSGIHLAVINRLAQEDPSKAVEYLAKHDKDISGADHVQAFQFTKDARAGQVAQQWIAERTQGGGGTQAAYDLGDAVEYAETGGNPNQVSSAGAAGAMQLIPSTARAAALRVGRADIAGQSDEELTKTLRENRDLNRTLGRNELGHLLKKYHGDVEAALVGYNAGEGGADAFLQANAGKGPGQRTYEGIPGHPGIATETKGYVEKVLKNFSDNRGTGAIGSTPPGTRMTRGNWTLKNFSPEDLTAPTPGGAWVDAHAATALDNIVDQMKAQFPDFDPKGMMNLPRDASGNTAGRRRGTADPNDNPHVKHSEHLRGDAFDVQVQGWDNEKKAAFLVKARQAGFGGIGFYGPKGHLHIDMGKPRTWGPMPAWAMNAMQVKVGGSGPRGGQDPINLAGDRPSSGDGAGYPGVSNGVVNTNKPALMALLAQSESIEDPTTRERVQSSIRTQAAAQEADDKAQAAAVKQTAWDMVLNGQPIPPQVQSKLGREEFAALQSYQEKQAAGALTTDYDRLIQFKSGTTQEKAATDINDLRPYLNKSDTDEVANLIAQARAAQNGDASAKLLESAMRSRADIVSDMADQMGWNDKGAGSAGKIAKANLNRRLDDQIAIELGKTSQRPTNSGYCRQAYHSRQEHGSVLSGPRHCFECQRP